MIDVASEFFWYSETETLLIDLCNNTFYIGSHKLWQQYHNKVAYFFDTVNKALSIYSDSEPFWSNITEHYAAAEDQLLLLTLRQLKDKQDYTKTEYIGYFILMFTFSDHSTFQIHESEFVMMQHIVSVCIF